MFHFVLRHFVASV